MCAQSVHHGAINTCTARMHDLILTIVFFLLMPKKNGFNKFYFYTTEFIICCISYFSKIFKDAGMRLTQSNTEIIGQKIIRLLNEVRK